jgi:hypothetical protein
MIRALTGHGSQIEKQLLLKPSETTPDGRRFPKKSETDLREYSERWL